MVDVGSVSSSDTAKSLILHEIRRSIIMGHCQPGERLDLTILSRKYGTSVTPVRDALQMLDQAGLVVTKARSGYFVAHVTLKQLRDLLDLREILELAAVERASTRITVSQLERLEQVHRGYTGDDDASYDRYTEENRTFHCLIAEASGNLELADQVGRLHDRLARFMVLRHAGETMERSHRQIHQALRARDVAAARQAVLDELQETQEMVLEHVIRAEEQHWQVRGDLTVPSPDSRLRAR